MSLTNKWQCLDTVATLATLRKYMHLIGARIGSQVPLTAALPYRRTTVYGLTHTNLTSLGLFEATIGATHFFPATSIN